MLSLSWLQQGDVKQGVSDQGAQIERTDTGSATDATFLLVYFDQFSFSLPFRFLPFFSLRPPFSHWCPSVTISTLCEQWTFQRCWRILFLEVAATTESVFAEAARWRGKEKLTVCPNSFPSGNWYSTRHDNTYYPHPSISPESVVLPWPSVFVFSQIFFT